ncbi:MAG TPA: hypothetical protein VHY32_11475, partial [Caulobacteraceae bacterium]|nr:hypothetical protein [Caulobacteraceae bacterium]
IGLHPGFVEGRYDRTCVCPSMEGLAPKSSAHEATMDQCAVNPSPPDILTAQSTLTPEVEAVSDFGPSGATANSRTRPRVRTPSGSFHRLTLPARWRTAMGAFANRSGDPTD